MIHNLYSNIKRGQKVPSSDKHTSLLLHGVNYSIEYFRTHTYGVCSIKPLTTVNNSVQCVCHCQSFLPQSNICRQDRSLLEWSPSRDSSVGVGSKSCRGEVTDNKKHSSLSLIMSIKVIQHIHLVIFCIGKICFPNTGKAGGLHYKTLWIRNLRIPQ